MAASIYCINIREEYENIFHIPYDVFNIVLEIRYVSSLNLETTLESFNQSFTYDRDMILSDEYGPNIVFSMLANTGVPLEYLRTIVVPCILAFAWMLDGDPVNVGLELITFKVEVVFQVTTDNNEVYEEVIIDDDEAVVEMIDESLNTLNFKPATSSSILALKRFKWGDDDDDDDDQEEEEEEGRLPLKKRKGLLKGSSSMKECRICLDEFSDGDEVASMPCRHVYHDGCIVKWLKTSHLCPLCRFQMPS